MCIAQLQEKQHPAAALNAHAGDSANRFLQIQSVAHPGAHPASCCEQLTLLRCCILTIIFQGKKQMRHPKQEICMHRTSLHQQQLSVAAVLVTHCCDAQGLHECNSKHKREVCAAWTRCIMSMLASEALEPCIAAARCSNVGLGIPDCSATQVQSPIWTNC